MRDINTLFEALYMKIVSMRAWISIGLAFVGLLSVVLSYFYQQYLVLILSIQAILLSAIYTVGSNYVEERIKEDYQVIIEEIKTDTAALNEKYYYERMKNAQLRRKK